MPRGDAYRRGPLRSAYTQCSVVEVAGSRDSHFPLARGLSADVSKGHSAKVYKNTTFAIVLDEGTWQQPGATVPAARAPQGSGVPPGREPGSCSYFLAELDQEALDLDLRFRAS